MLCMRWYWISYPYRTCSTRKLITFWQMQPNYILSCLLAIWELLRWSNVPTFLEANNKIFPGDFGIQNNIISFMFTFKVPYTMIFFDILKNLGASPATVKPMAWKRQTFILCSPWFVRSRQKSRRVTCYHGRLSRDDTFRLRVDIKALTRHAVILGRRWHIHWS